MIPPMSRDRFNSNVDRKVKTEATPIRRVEVITGVERRRDWTDEQKLSIIAESCQDGVVISDVARRHGLRRNEFRKRTGLVCSGAPAFVPVMIESTSPKAWLRVYGSPHRKEQWVIPPEASGDFVAAMEEVLDVYVRPHDPETTLVCLDETSKHLLPRRERQSR